MFCAAHIDIKANDISVNNKERVKGIIFEGFIEPISWLKECLVKKLDEKNYCQRHLDSRDYYYGYGYYKNKSAIDLAVNHWSINTVRLNLSQSALDPKSPWFSKDYINEIKNLVSYAKKRDLLIILALFPASNRNAPDFLEVRNPNKPLNTLTTLRAALELNSVFGKDSAVLIELLNEPWSPTSRDNGWRLWLDGGILRNHKSKFNNEIFIGCQTIVDILRHEGSQNAIIIQGLEMSFIGMPHLVNDSLHRIIYSIHPFFNEESQNQNLWNKNFGNFAKKNPFIISAWQAKTLEPWCKISEKNVIPKFFDYLSSNNIGLIGYAFDVPYTITKNFQTDFDTPSASNFECNNWGGVGVLMKKHFNDN